MKSIYIKILFSLIAINISANVNQYKWSEPVNIAELNTQANDFAPSWNRYDNILLFNSDISGYSKFYYTKFSEFGKFSDAKPLAGDINQLRNNQSYITFESGDNAFLSTFRLTENRSYLNIYQSRYRKMSWSKPIIADSLQFDSFTSHPTVSPDGSILIFSSDRNTEHNETDLWMAFKQENGSWGSIINISELNSPGNEITPYLASKDTLYFASDGQEGPGGFDMFMSVYENGSWGRPNPLSELNTSSNESDICILPKGEIIFASDRPGGKGKLDLYISIPESTITPVDTILQKIEINLAAQVFSLQSKKVNSSQTYFIPDFILSNGFNNNKELNLFNNPDSIFNNIPGIIGKRMNENQTCKLIISCSATSFELANNLKNYLTGIGISESRILIESVRAVTNNGQIKSEPVFFELVNDNNFRFVDASSENILLSPPILEFTVDARPRKEVKSWNCGMIAKNLHFNNLFNGDSLPSEFAINLTGFSKEIDESDSIIIKFDAQDYFGKTHSYELTMNVNHSAIKDSNSIKIKNKIYHQFIVFAFNKESVNIKNNSIARLLNKLKDISAKNVIVQYNIQNNNTIATAEAISVIIKRENINAKSDYDNNTTQIVSDSLKPYVFRILIEQQY